MKCDISQHRQTQHTLCIRHTWRILISPMLPMLSLLPSLVPPNTISARSETELGLSISCRFHAEKITKVFAAILHTHTHTRARIEEFSCVFPPTYYCLNIYTTNSSGRRGRGRQQRYRVCRVPCAVLATYARQVCREAAKQGRKVRTQPTSPRVWHCHVVSWALGWL